MESAMNQAQYERLRDRLRSLVSQGLCIAFSGGVDSSLLLKAACNISKEKGEKVYAVTFLTKLHPHGEMEEARQTALEFGAIHDVIEVDEFADREILKNPVDRCYRCKRLLFQTLRSYAQERNLLALADGTNADDLHQYRPGIRALHELGVASPLAECGLTKADVRRLSHTLGLKASEKPSAPCLATRIPYNTLLDFNVLQNIDKGEAFLKELGYPVVRIRLHGDIARIEVPKEKLSNILGDSDLIISRLKGLGFSYVTLDLKGFRSGSMDQKIKSGLTGREDMA